MYNCILDQEPTVGIMKANRGTQKDDKRILKERIKAGEQMRKVHEKILRRASEAVDQAMHLFGDRDEALRVSPEAYVVQKEEKRIAEIDKKLEELKFSTRQ